MQIVQIEIAPLPALHLNLAGSPSVSATRLEWPPASGGPAQKAALGDERSAISNRNPAARLGGLIGSAASWRRLARLCLLLRLLPSRLVDLGAHLAFSRRWHHSSSRTPSSGFGIPQPKQSPDWRTNKQEKRSANKPIHWLHFGWPPDFRSAARCRHVSSKISCVSGGGF